MSERKKIEDQALLYHLTCMDNLPNILETGLRSRASVKGEFVDVADGEIITGREALNLQTMVPFHFFTKNPFDGRVLRDHKKNHFALFRLDEYLLIKMVGKLFLNIHYPPVLL